MEREVFLCNLAGLDGSDPITRTRAHYTLPQACPLACAYIRTQSQTAKLAVHCWLLPNLLCDVFVHLRFHTQSSSEILKRLKDDSTRYVTRSDGRRGCLTTTAGKCYPRPGDERSILAGIAHAGGKHDEGHTTSLGYCYTY